MREIWSLRANWCEATDISVQISADVGRSCEKHQIDEAQADATGMKAQFAPRILRGLGDIPTTAAQVREVLMAIDGLAFLARCRDCLKVVLARKPHVFALFF